ncbi:MAG: hypothetical protein ACK46X_00875 [Candidatus Sericytochromatia bacterium]
MSDFDRLEMLLRALPFDERMALEEKWAAEGTAIADQLREAEAVAAEAGDGCDLL